MSSDGITELAVEDIVNNTDDTDAPKRGYTLEELDPSHEHHKRILADFQAAGICVIKIEKLQNSALIDDYISKRKLMLKHRGDMNYKLNEKYLYHGTTAKRSYICELGLDDKLAGEGSFGKGIYFSDNIKKCLKYANRRNGDEGVIVCARTILGNSKVYEDGEKDPRLKTEPEKKGDMTGFRFYCSVTGRPRDYNEFVVYRKNQILVEYFITYSKTLPPQTNVTAPTTEHAKPVTSSPPSTKPAASSPTSTKPAASSASVEPDSSSPLPTKHSSQCSVTSEPSSDEEEEGTHLSADEFDGIIDDVNSSLDEDDEIIDDVNSSLDEDDEIIDNVNSSLDEDNSPSLNFRDSEGGNQEEPEEEMDPAKKREIFIEKTGEKNDSVIDSFLLATDYHLDIAIDLYVNREKIEEELERMRATLEEEGLPTTDEDGNEITFHPAGIPHYDTEEWKMHSESEQQSFIENFLSIFMDAIALDREHSEFAKGFLQNNNYNIDQTIIAFYSSI